MSKEALGLIETVGLAAAIEAADTCMKSANVELIGYELTKGYGMVTVKIKGDVSAVKAAIESAKVSASAVNTVYATLVIPRPVDKLDLMIESSNTIGLENKFVGKKETIEIPEEIINEEVKIVEKLALVEESVVVVNSIIVDGAVQETTTEGICNLCYDPKCSRKKGMTRKLCIHYKDSEGDKK
ncbi:BMC domain-containing protein [Clostridium estertheticum]|uniref:BMC domain-containing protein n=1 Tax=Clostridium estertheticum TaxID=238834 RepID=UPI001CF4B65C|nr:BMC domain-containing protein [Clostridium estertheticum]MCB2352717.1 BMC domain-containing protein [Clostridium estertheticum]WAG40025.1 BMC domain-containing protein [Clostridium estertheticum]